ncbi:MAG: response regulator transcription factor [Anaerolineae bacterium]|nr:response regulator transcription factor [Anaerolineae bacterium]
MKTDSSGRRILLIEDERKIADFIRRGLALEGYQVQVAYDGESGLDAAVEQRPDLIILDIMLPAIDGIEVCKALRDAGFDMPILMLTARDAVRDRVAGLDAGADDYLVKPFAFDELLARIRALLRRRAAAEEEVLQFADLTLRPATREVTRGGRPIDLTAREFDILETFMRHPRQVLTREQLYERIWGYDFSGESNIIEVYIRYLRAKLEANGEPRLIHTVRGVGYVLREA